ncbi:VPLPA-CTERM sorting domain-containing protein [Rubrimonas cliftonensis]|uniref:VPLPA-CTERM protein sorting domain-containing protein n=1 Tax=Rubrimonas cliftonensis TaxID=89524 RepID=A0A1H4FE07_9RHOB|nr:VPLPA-CTERM sorting domain-containing protein [Rubrimonas cliftonensis]SEA95070.1 VPLPA-CTERM protein sorting domain-containing protein [Rubrimonas cliftonensis]
MRIKTVTMAAAITLAAGVASAATIDFTDRSVWNSAASTTSVFGATVSISATGGAINFTQDYDRSKTGVCDGFGGALACVSDGLGVTDDEITTEGSMVQTATVSFSSAVFVKGFSFLDLYLATDGSDLETAKIYFNDDMSTMISFAALQTPSANQPGFVVGLANVAPVTSITFFAAPSNDNLGNPDYSLASIEVAPVPLPAAAWMLLAGLAGMGYVARGRKNA